MPEPTVDNRLPVRITIPGGSAIGVSKALCGRSVIRIEVDSDFAGGLLTISEASQATENNVEPVFLPASFAGDGSPVTATIPAAPGISYVSAAMMPRMGVVQIESDMEQPSDTPTVVTFITTSLPW